MDNTPLTPEYEPYGSEWEKEMSKFPKLQLIKRLAGAYKGVRDRDALQARLLELEKKRKEDYDDYLKLYGVYADMGLLAEKLMKHLEEWVGTYGTHGWQSYKQENGLQLPEKTEK